MVPDGGTAAVLFLCTGNAARSVMAGAALRELRPDLSVGTAGTLSVDGLRLGWRTRAALHAVGLPAPRHTSRQATAEDLDRADVVLGLAPEHVAWVRRHHPAASARTTTLRHAAIDLALPGPPLGVRIARLDLAHREPAPREEVIDPGGGDAAGFVACAHEVVGLVGLLAVRL